MLFAKGRDLAPYNFYFDSRRRKEDKENIKNNSRLMRESK